MLFYYPSQYNKRREELHRLQEKHPELAARLAAKVRSTSGHVHHQQMPFGTCHCAQPLSDARIGPVGSVGSKLWIGPVGSKL